MKKWKSLLAAGLMLLLAACGPADVSSASATSYVSEPTVTEQAPEESSSVQKTDGTAKSVPEQTESSYQSGEMGWSVIPAYSGIASIEINGNVPYFTDDELAQATESYEFYSPLDDYGRCGYAMASVGADLMPTEERGDISSVHPTGWFSMKESSIGPERCHLIAYMLTGENANERNLITGTRFLNTEGMLPFENKVADYVKNTGHHVLYKVIPVFEGNDLVAKGVWMQAMSVEDDNLAFNVFCYNVQPGIGIDHANGDSWRE